MNKSSSAPRHIPHSARDNIIRKERRDQEKLTAPTHDDGDKISSCFRTITSASEAERHGGPWLGHTTCFYYNFSCATTARPFVIICANRHVFYAFVWPRAADSVSCVPERSPKLIIFWNEFDGEKPLKVTSRWEINKIKRGCDLGFSFNQGSNRF